MWTSSPPSTPSARSPRAVANPWLPKTMEDVWKDITLATDLHHPPSGGVVLQDFFSKDPPLASVSPNGFPASPPPPRTRLTLSSGPDQFSSLLPISNHQVQPIPLANMSLDAVVPDHNGDGGKRRFPDFERSSGDRRHKRMIKNRESAARSRARKQAYTNELELEVAHLLEENARLKKQKEKLYRAAAAEDHKKKPLQRTSTAPF